MRLLLNLQIWIINYMVQADNINYIQNSSCLNSTLSGKYTANFSNLKPCQIIFIYNGSIDDTLYIQDAQISDFQATSFGNFTVQNSTFQTCSPFNINSSSTIYFDTVNISPNNSGCKNYTLQFTAQNIIFTKVIISGYKVQKYDSFISLNSKQNMNLSNVTVKNNFCLQTNNMLMLTSQQQISVQFMTFQDNIIILGSLMTVSQGFQGIQANNTFFYRNSVSSGSFLSLQRCQQCIIIQLQNFSIQQNVIDHVFTDPTRISMFDLAKDFKNAQFLKDNNLITIDVEAHYTINNFSFLDNNLNYQFQVVILLSSMSGSHINGIHFFNNTILCLQITILKFTEEFGNDIENFNYDQSNIRNPDDIIIQSQQQLQFIKYLEKILKTDVQLLYTYFCSMLKSNFYNQFPIIGIVTQESVSLNLLSFNIILNNQTVFQIVLSQNQVQMLKASLNSISISRISYDTQIFDIGAFVITGVFSNFYLSNLTLSNLRMGKRSMIMFESKSYYAISASYNIILEDITIINSQIYILDHSNQISLIQIYNNVKQNIQIQNLKMSNISFFSYPQYYGQFQGRIQQICVTNNFQLNFDPQYFLTPQNQSLSLFQQTAILNIQSVYSLVIISDWNLFNISVQYEQYGIYVISNTLKLNNLVGDKLNFAEEDVNLLYQQFLSFYGTIIILSNIILSNQKSLINQVFFIEIMGENSSIYIKNTTLLNLSSSGGLDSIERPIIQIHSKATSQFQIVINRLQTNQIKNFNQGGLLSIIQIENTTIFIQLQDISFNNTQLYAGSTVIFINLTLHIPSQVFFKNINFTDDKSIIIATQKFNFIKLEYITHLTIQQIFIQSSLLKQALSITNVNQIILSNFTVFNSLIISDENFIILDKFIKALFQKITIDSLISQNNKIINFKNLQFNDYSEVYLQGIILKNNINQVCCTQFFSFYNTNVMVHNLKAFQNYNYTLIYLNASQLQLDQCQFNQNELTQNLRDLQNNQVNIWNGSIIDAFQSQVMISNTIFSQSKGSYLGGAIHYQVEVEDLLEQIYNLYFGQGVIFSQCSAEYGGAIYHKSLNPESNFKSVTFQQNEDFNKQFNDIATIPNQIFVNIVEQNIDKNEFIVKYAGYVTNSTELYIYNIKSGSQFNLTLQFMEDNRIHNDFIEVDFNGFLQFNFYNGSYQFTLEQLKNNTKSFQIDIFNSIKREILLVNLTIKFNLQFRNCIPGEIQVLDALANNFICAECPTKTYSFSNNSLQCYDCPQNADCINGTIYQIQNGWWRQNFTSNKLSKCDYNTCSEDQINQTQCTKGSIGPICDQCDAKGSQWTAHFQRKSGHKCSQCSTDQESIYYYVIIGVLVVLSVQYQLQTTYQDNILQCLVRYIKMIGFLPLGTSGLFNDNVYIKTLIFHFQILSMLQGLQKDSSLSQFIEKQNMLGNQSQTLVFTQDCVYGLYNFPIPSLAYLDVISAIFYSILIMTIGLLISLTDIVKHTFKPNYRKFIILYSYWTQVPQIAFYIMGALSCRNILGNYFVKADLSQTCLEKDHVFFLSTLLIPTLSVQILIGMIALFLLIKHKNHLELVKIQTLYGMLFQEYKNQYCYFEIVKLYLKLALVFFINILSDQPLIMTEIISFLLLYYYFTIKKLQPYVYYKTQRIDEYQILILVFTIQLMTMSQNSQTDYVQDITTILTLGINSILSFTIISYLIKFYLEQLNLRKIYEMTEKYLPLIRRFIKKPRINNMVVFNNWKTLRQFVIAKSNLHQEQEKLDQQPSILISNTQLDIFYSPYLLDIYNSQL